MIIENVITFIFKDCNLTNSREEAQFPGSVEYTDFVSAEWVRPLSPNECPRYDIKQSDDEAPALEFGGNVGVSLHCHFLPDLLTSGVVAPDRVLSIDQIELFDI